jgi:hypothetical protein
MMNSGERIMKRWMIVLMLAVSGLVLGGCATPTVKSTVTTFQEWPAELPNKIYVFERTKEQDNNLEYRSYENMVRTELNRLGFREASSSQAPVLKVTLDYGISARDVREIYPVMVSPGWPGPYWYGPYRRGYYGPYYDPFWYGPPVVEQRESNYVVYTRHLQVVIARAANGRKLFDTTVVSEGSNGSLPAVMPYLVRSAFTDFPGKSGVPRQVELKMAD